MWSSLMSSVKNISSFNLMKSSGSELKQLAQQFQNNDGSLLDAINSIEGNLIQVDGNYYPNARLLTENDKIIGILYGNHVLHLKMSKEYQSKIQKLSVIQTDNPTYLELIAVVAAKITERKNSTLNRMQVLTLQSYNELSKNFHLDNIICLDVSRFSKLRLFHLSSTRHFKKIKNYYSAIWKKVVLMKDFQIQKLYYKSSLLIGFTLYREEDGEKFFWSDQFQEVLELIETKELPFGDINFTMDSLLDKINKCGLQGLTQLERNFLKNN